MSVRVRSTLLPLVSWWDAEQLDAKQLSILAESGLPTPHPAHGRPRPPTHPPHWPLFVRVEHFVPCGAPTNLGGSSQMLMERIEKKVQDARTFPFNACIVFILKHLFPFKWPFCLWVWPETPTDVQMLEWLVNYSARANDKELNKTRIIFHVAEH